MSARNLYPASYYDDDLVLKVPLLLWAAMIVLVRHVLFLGLTFLPRVGDAMSYLRDIVEPAFLVADAVAAPVLLVALRRKPGSPTWMRRLWQQGRFLLAVSSLTYAALWIANLGIGHNWRLSGLDEALLMSVGVDLVVLAFVATSPLVRDVFRDFPAEDPR